MKSYGEVLVKRWIELWIDNASPIWKALSFNKPEVLINTRPRFLYGLELDFYIPSLKLAFEFQGEQHYQPQDYFRMSLSDFGQQVIHDIQKDLLCKKNGILLIRLNAWDLCQFKLLKQKIKNIMFSFYGYDWEEGRKIFPSAVRDEKTNKIIGCTIPSDLLSREHYILSIALRPIALFRFNSKEEFGKYTNNFRDKFSLHEKNCKEYYLKSENNGAKYSLKRTYCDLNWNEIFKKASSCPKFKEKLNQNLKARGGLSSDEVINHAVKMIF